MDVQLLGIQCFLQGHFCLLRAGVWVQNVHLNLCLQRNFKIVFAGLSLTLYRSVSVGVLSLNLLCVEFYEALDAFF